MPFLHQPGRLTAIAFLLLADALLVRGLCADQRGDAAPVAAFAVAPIADVEARPGDSAGRDVLDVFTRAARGEPLRYVAIGGSITQGSGPGWVGDWLSAEFPESAVMAVNSGISGTNSVLGTFRIERDVIAYQPDLVAIEYCENDGPLSDEDSIRHMESLVVRLKSLPRPPAILVLEVAAQDGTNLRRHRLVARHYGLLEVDWQAAMDARLRQADGGRWEDYFGDRVHPSRAGNEFYAQVMRETLAPLIARAKAAAKATTTSADHAEKPSPALPAPLSAKPLLLDARMIPLHGLREPSGAWKSESAPATVGGPFFQGVLTAHKPAAVLRLPFRGTTVGLYYPLQQDQGSFYASVDGQTLPIQIFQNRPRGSAMRLLAADLPAGEHRLELALPPADERDPEIKINGPVRLGYLLVAGETATQAHHAAQGPFHVEALRKLRFTALPASGWSWLGPFREPGATNGARPSDAAQAIHFPFLGESGPETMPAEANLAWRKVESHGSWVDFRALTGLTEPGVAYAKTEWPSERGGPAILALEADYFARLWLNGERVLTLEGPHPDPVSVMVQLRPGVNVLFLKLGAGRDGFRFRARLGERE